MLLLSRRKQSVGGTPVLRSRSPSSVKNSRNSVVSSGDESHDDMDISGSQESDEEPEADKYDKQTVLGNQSSDVEDGNFTDDPSSQNPSSDEEICYQEHNDRRSIEQKKLRNKYVKLKKEIRQAYNNKRGHLEVQNLDTRKVESTKKFSAIWQTIIEKYSEYDADDQGDIINLNDFSIEDNRGHIENLNERSSEDIWLKTHDNEKPKKYEQVSEPNFDPFEDPINLINLTPQRTPSPSKKSSVKGSRACTPSCSSSPTSKNCVTLSKTAAYDPLSLLKQPKIRKSLSPMKAFKSSPLRLSKSSPMKPSTPTKTGFQPLVPRITPRHRTDSDPISILTPTSSAKRKRNGYAQRKLSDDLGLLGLGSSPTKRKSQGYPSNDPILLLTPNRTERILLHSEPVINRNESAPPPRPNFQSRSRSTTQQVSLSGQNPLIPDFSALDKQQSVVVKMMRTQLDDGDIPVIEVSDSEDD